MIALLNWRIWAAVAIMIFQVAFGWKMYHSGMQSVQAKWDAEKLELVSQTNKLLEKRDADSRALQDDKDKLRKAKNAEIDRLNTDLADALERLRHRPERPSESNLPSNTTAGSEASCTGAGLYREDADFLVREAARAKRILLDLRECQAAYDKAREALK